jgi:hypothetical protein
MRRLPGPILLQVRGSKMKMLNCNFPPELKGLVNHLKGQLIRMKTLFWWFLQ